MLTPFKLALRASGPEADRQLFWETGMIGQSLYYFTIGTAVDDPRLRRAPPYREERTEK
ncbi:MAG: hypothetical protein ACI9NQ_000780 [Paracoccaceae bacterium]|jgi:hypothetical protein